MNIKLMILFLWLISVAAFAATEYHIDPVNGNSSASATGTLTDPFRTIAQAQAAVRAVNGTMASDIVVYLHAGTYNLSSTLTFSAQDGGSNGFNVVYKAYNNDKPIITGGKAITGWSAVSGKGYYKASVPTSMGFPTNMRNIFVNGKRAIQARGSFIPYYPFSYDDPATTQYRDGYYVKTSDLKSYTNTGDIRIFQQGWFKHIEIPLLRIQSITNTESALVMKQSSFYNWTNTYTYQTPGIIQVWNALEELDEPGEFYLDWRASTVYYYPRPGEDMTTADAVAPAVETLLKVTGTATSFTNNIRFEGIAFQYGNWNGWVNKEMGRSQADLYSDYTAMEGQIQLQYTNNITFRGCRFEHLLGSGIYMPDNNNYTTIQGNIFNDLTAAAVLVGKNMTPSATVNNYTLIDNNVVRSIGADFFQASGIYANVSNNLTITHNDVADVAYFGINQRYSDVSTNYVGNTQVMYNKVSNFCTATKYGFGLNDIVSAFYFYGVQNSVFSHNYGEYGGNSPVTTIFREDQGGLNNRFVENVANSKNALTKSFSFYPDQQSNLVFDNNYGNVADDCPTMAGGTSTNFHLEPNAPTTTPWSAPAKAIVDSAGLQKQFKYLLTGFGPDVYDTSTPPTVPDVNWSGELLNYTKPYRYLFTKDAALYRLHLGSPASEVSKHNDSILIVSGYSGSNAVFTGAFYGNEYIRVKALFSGNGTKIIAFRAPNSGNFLSRQPNYSFGFTQSTIQLTRNGTDLINTTLIGTNGIISAAKSYTSKLYTTGSIIDIYTNNESNGVRIILMIDGVKVIDCLDSSAGYITTPGFVMFNSGYTGGGTITLMDAPAINVTGVSLNKTTLNLNVGKTFQLVSIVTPSNATYTEVVYSSSNPAVATVSATGVVTVKAIGVARITVTTRDGNLTATCDVNASLTALNDIVCNNKLSVSVSKSGTGSYHLKINGISSTNPVSLRLTDLLGRVVVERKNVLPLEGQITIEAKLPENMNMAVVQLQNPRGKTQMLKISLK